MLRAIELSIQSAKTKGGPFGCVIVKDNKIIAEGFNQVTSNNDPTAHAEIVAIRNACKNQKDFFLKGCDLYSTCEPCPMCLSAIYWAHIDNIFYANTRLDAKNIDFDDSFIYSEINKVIENRKIKMHQMHRDEALEALKAAYKKADDKNLPVWKKKFTEIRYDAKTLAEFKAKVGKPIWDEWVAANKDQFDAQAVLDVILNFKYSNIK